MPGFVLLAVASGVPAMAQDDDAAGSDFLLRALGLRPLDGKELAAVEAEAAKHPLGSKENPVRAQDPAGQRAYLKRLRCPSGKAPSFERAGDVGPGIYGSIVDRYQVECKDGLKAEVIIDMYHRGYVEKQPVPGFTIVAP
jgi:hypothetical protein